MFLFSIRKLNNGNLFTLQKQQNNNSVNNSSSNNNDNNNNSISNNNNNKKEKKKKLPINKHTKQTTTNNANLEPVSGAQSPKQNHVYHS